MGVRRTCPLSRCVRADYLDRPTIRSKSSPPERTCSSKAGYACCAGQCQAGSSVEWGQPRRNRHDNRLLKARLESHHHFNGSCSPIAETRGADHAFAICDIAAATLSSARWHHSPDGRIPRRVASAIRIRRLSQLNEIGTDPAQSCKRKRLRLRPMYRNWIWLNDARPVTPKHSTSL